MVNNPLSRRCRAVEKSLGSCHFCKQGMGDRGPKACGPCVALASKECQANPNRTSVYTLVPSEYAQQNSLEVGASVCRSRLCHAKVRLRAEPKPAGRPVGWQKRVREASAEVAVGTIAKPEHVRQRPAIVNEIFQIKASRCANGLTPMPASCMSARHLPCGCDPLVAGLIESTASVTRATRTS